MAWPASRSTSRRATVVLPLAVPPPIPIVSGRTDPPRISLYRTAGELQRKLARGDPAGRGWRASMAKDSAEVSRIATEALDIAKSAGQTPTTAHLLLATFTVPSAADVLLRERGCDEDRVLTELSRPRL